MPPSGTIAPDQSELNLLREWREPLWSRRVLSAGIGSVLVHVAVIVFLLSLPDIAPREAPVVADLRKSVHLVAPKFYEPTQKAPNTGKIKRELDVRSSEPVRPSPAPRFVPPAPPPGPIAPAPPITPALQPPKIELPPPVPPVVATPIPQAPPPASPEKPKLAFESVGSVTPVNPNPQIQPPKTSIQDAVKSAIQPGGGGLIVGDVGDNLSSLSNPQQTQMQLLSDPKGVDFKPYLIQVLAAVRRNWMAIIPESARMGRRGKVLIQFIIDRRGGVPKLVIAEPSGTEAFDRAAVAGISASYPFPPLPTDYTGDQIRLQLAFSYNLAPR
jgi:TonB family protein